MEQRLVCDIVRICRERQFKSGTKQPPNLVAMACFQARVIMLQCPQKFETDIPDEDYTQLLEICVHHLTRKNCPAQETIQMQVNAHVGICRELELLELETKQRKQVLEEIMQEIVRIKVLDMRETYSTVVTLYSRILDYVLESGHQVEQAKLLNEAEVRVALGSIFPQAGLLYWIDLESNEKKLQIQELADIVPGIRAYNKFTGRGSSYLKIPIENFEAKIDPLRRKVMEEMLKVEEKAKKCAQAIKLHILHLGMHHVLIQRLRDELAYSIQAFGILESLYSVLNTKLSLVTDFHDKLLEYLKELHNVIGSRESVPNELVFPVFKAVGKLQKLISEEVRMLQSYSIASRLLLTNVSEPSFQYAPTGLADLSTMRGLAKLDILNMYSTFLPAELYTVDWLENDYMFAETPGKFLAAVENVVRKMPQLVQILRLHHRPTFSSLSIAKVIEAISVSFPCDFATQTCLHIAQQYQWDTELSMRRMTKSENKESNRTQTLSCFFQRDSNSQVWLLKEEQTQTPYTKGTKLARWVRHMQGLRGAPKSHFKMLETKFEV